MTEFKYTIDFNDDGYIYESNTGERRTLSNEQVRDLFWEKDVVGCWTVDAELQYVQYTANPALDEIFSF